MILLGNMIFGAAFERPGMITLTVREAGECSFEPETLCLSLSPDAGVE